MHLLLDSRPDPSVLDSRVQQLLEGLLREGPPDTPRRIRCPCCAWQPRARDRWSCECGCAWNTFETAGRCPACAVQWRHTQCLRCTRWSRHEDWYAPAPQPSGSHER
jgi:hypothetical protein